MINALQALHQIGAVISFREYGPAENYFRHLGIKAVFSPTRITLRTNGKIWPKLYQEKRFSRASGGDEGIRTLETVSRLLP